MPSTFKNQFATFIKANYKGIAEPTVLQGNAFTCWHPHARLVFQLIDYKTFAAQALHQNYFQLFNLAMDTRHTRVINIWEDRWFSHTQLVQNMLLNYLKTNKKLGARSCLLQPLTGQDVSFFEHNHILGSAGAHYKYGLFYQNNLMACATFSKARIMTDGPNLYHSYELVRFANLQGHTVAGGLGKLLKHFIAARHPQHIMTYIDLDWGDGNAFIKLGFVKKAFTEPNLFYVDPTNHQRTYYKNAGVTPLANDKFIYGFNAGNAKLVLDLRNL